MWYIVLMDPYDYTDYDTEPFDHEPTVDELNDWSQIIGRLNAGAYQANTPEEAVTQALEHYDEWSGGCVA